MSAEGEKKGHEDLGQQQTKTLNDADWNQQSDERRELNKRREDAKDQPASKDSKD